MRILLICLLLGCTYSPKLRLSEYGLASGLDVKVYGTRGSAFAARGREYTYKTWYSGTADSLSCEIWYIGVPIRYNSYGDIRGGEYDKVYHAVDRSQGIEPILVYETYLTFFNDGEYLIRMSAWNRKYKDYKDFTVVCKRL